MHGRIHVCVGWLVHVIHSNYVHAEPRSKFYGGGGGGATSELTTSELTFSCRRLALISCRRCPCFSFRCFSLSSCPGSVGFSMGGCNGRTTGKPSILHTYCPPLKMTKAKAEYCAERKHDTFSCSPRKNASRSPHPTSKLLAALDPASQRHRSALGTCTICTCTRSQL